MLEEFVEYYINIGLKVSYFRKKARRDMGIHLMSGTVNFSPRLWLINYKKFIWRHI